MSFLNFREAGSCCASGSPATASRQTRRRILNSNTKAQLQAKESTVQACWESQPVQTPYVPLLNHLAHWTRPRKTVQTNGARHCGPCLEMDSAFTLQRFSANCLLLQVFSIRCNAHFVQVLKLVREKCSKLATD